HHRFAGGVVVQLATSATRAPCVIVEISSTGPARTTIRPSKAPTGCSGVSYPPTDAFCSPHLGRGGRRDGATVLLERGVWAARRRYRWCGAVGAASALAVAVVAALR